MKVWIPGTEDPTLDGLPLARSGPYISFAYPPTLSTIPPEEIRF